jgi:hypothetical protein
MSGRVLICCADDLGFHVVSVSVLPPLNRTWIFVILYDPTGPVKSLPLGNGLTETWTFLTAQKQPTGLVAAKNGTNLLSLGWGYGADSTNNGNILSATIVGNGVNASQSFGYL